jgi:hypothetical protein
LPSAWILGLTLFAVVPSGVTRADHCSEEREAPGKPEARLAGVPVLEGAVLDVTKHLGAPTAIETFPDEEYHGSGERQYSWKRRYERVVVTTMFAPPGSAVGPEEPYSVELVRDEGAQDAPPQRLATGRGIKLGASRSAVVAKYGPVFLEGKRSATLSYCWMNDTWLTFEFDSSGSVTRVHLLGSVE